MKRPSPQALAPVLAGALVLGTLAACDVEPSPEPAVRGFLLNWQQGTYDRAAKLTTGDPRKVAASLAAMRTHLDAAAIRLRMGRIELDGDRAFARFAVQADLGLNDPVWSYDGRMTLKHTSGGWKVEWSPSVIHPHLSEGQRVAVVHEVPKRAPITDAKGHPLVAETPVVVLGVRPAEVKDLRASVGELAKLTNLDPDRMLSRVRSAPPRDFVALVTVRQQTFYAKHQAELRRIQGLVAKPQRVPLSPRYNPGLIGGVVGAATSEIVQEVGGPYQPGDSIGLTGLQRAFQRRLAGTTTTKVVSLDGQGKEVGTLQQWSGEDSLPVRTTLEVGVQRAAEAAVAAQPGDASVVAVQASTGRVLAVAGKPWSYENDSALTSHLPPGETFTLVSSEPLLRSGIITPNSSIPCPQQRIVDGKTFRNSRTMGGGAPRFSTNFAYACTTAFVGLARRVNAGQLAEAAGRFGIGGHWRLPLPAFTGRLEAPGNAADLADTVIGDDGIEVSPLGMALAAGAVADGSWRSPRLVIDPIAPGGGAATALDKKSLSGLRSAMRATVKQGAARSADLPGEPISGQVGTAVRKSGDSQRSLDWFVGYRGDIAFAVVVETPARMRNAYAVPTAAAFLGHLPARGDSRR
ncbi:MAG: cell division protein FtsI [Streptosporangiales bacterium]|nr:cell division protein FtsI [Streptosporangiales bacterium]